jgi:cellulose synthase/poly-beta-1,6-N-acetylglucosamine synthase-like glycosyltransferase
MRAPNALEPAEVIVVDVRDEGGLKASVRASIAANTRIRYLHIDLRITHQKNTDVHESSREIVLILDDDIILRKTSVQEILNVFNDPDLVGIGIPALRSDTRRVLWCHCQTVAYLQALAPQPSNGTHFTVYIVISNSSLLSRLLLTLVPISLRFASF